MKKVILCFLVFISFSCFAQSKDSASRTSQPMTIKADSVQTIMNDFLEFLQDKVTVKQYLPVQQMVNAFIISKEAEKRKKK